MKTISEIRAAARAQLKGKRVEAILVCLIFAAVLGVSGVIVVGPYLLGGPLLLGFTGYFLNKVRGKTAKLEDLFESFKLISSDGGMNIIGQSILLYILRSLFIILWSLLLIVPGIIKSISYSMAFYIMKDNPKIGGLEAITQSRVMMNGHKGRYFLLYLSFIGWFLLFNVPFLCAVIFSRAAAFFAVLGTLTLLAGSIWLLPYIVMSVANFYEDLKKSVAKKPAAKKPAAKKPAAKKPKD